MKTENVKMKLKMIKTSSCTAPSYLLPVQMDFMF